MVEQAKAHLLDLWFRRADTDPRDVIQAVNRLIETARQEGATARPRPVPSPYKDHEVR